RTSEIQDENGMMRTEDDDFLVLPGAMSRIFMGFGKPNPGSNACAALSSSTRMRHIANPHANATAGVLIGRKWHAERSLFRERFAQACSISWVVCFSCWDF